MQATARLSPQHEAPPEATRQAPVATRPLIAVVPLRAGSKGFPGKNTALIAGRPLYEHAIRQGIEAGASRVIVTTDIREVLEATHDEGVLVHRRPAELTGDDVPMAPVLADVLARPEADGADVVLLQATSPMRRPEQIREAVDQLRAAGVDLVMSVRPADAGVLKYGTVEDGRFQALRDPRHPFTNRQDLPPVYRPNGAIYVFAAEWYREHGSFDSASVGAYVMSAEDSVDIDTPQDLNAAAARWPHEKG